MKKYLLLFAILVGVFASFFIYKSPFVFFKIHSIFTRVTCFGTNKKVLKWGFAHNTACVTTYPDAGKQCNSSTECLSQLCVVTTNNSQGICRGISEDYPLCVNGEAKIETLKTQDSTAPEGQIQLSPFTFCD